MFCLFPEIYWSLDEVILEQYWRVSYCSALLVRIFFINPRPACHDTEKDGEGERDTGTTSGKGVTRYVDRGYLRTYSLGRWRGTRKTSPPPYNPTPLDSFEAGLRMASNMEVMCMIADIGQQQ
jgi:hypothetical protein